MFIPLVYLIVKRVGWIKTIVVRRVSMRTLLTIHIYAGVLGPILALVHSSHRFESLAGITLVSFMFLVVLSGFAGRYLLNQTSREIREKKAQLTEIGRYLPHMIDELAARPEELSWARRHSGLFARSGAALLAMRSGGNRLGMPLGIQAMEMAQATADLEYAIKTHDVFKRWFSRWLKFHIVISVMLYAVLSFHIWSELYLGLRSL
jgi:hypothetical protein